MMGPTRELHDKIMPKLVENATFSLDARCRSFGRFQEFALVEIHWKFSNHQNKKETAYTDSKLVRFPIAGDKVPYKL